MLAIMMAMVGQMVELGQMVSPNEPAFLLYLSTQLIQQLSVVSRYIVPQAPSLSPDVIHHPTTITSTPPMPFFIPSSTISLMTNHAAPKSLASPPPSHSSLAALFICPTTSAIARANPSPLCQTKS